MKHPINNGSTVCIESPSFEGQIYGTVIYYGTANYYFIIPDRSHHFNIPISILLQNEGTHYLFHNLEEDYEIYFKPNEAYSGFWIHKVAITRVVSPYAKDFTLDELLEQLEHDTN